MIYRGFVLTGAAALIVIAAGYSNCGRVPVPSGSGSSGNQSTSIATGGGTTSVGNPLVALPKVILDSDYPPVTGRTLTVGSSGRMYNNCQTAINAAAPGDEVVVDAGFACAPITLPNKGISTKFIVIRSSDISLLPSQGTRISRTDSAHLAIIETPTQYPAIQTNSLANHYYIGGFEIRLASSVNSENFELVKLGSGLETSLDQLPHDLIIARSWIHGSSSQELKQGITLNGSAISIVDSIVEEVHVHNQYNFAIAGWNTGVGPFKIVNNELVSAGSGFAVGAAQSTIANSIPSDIEVRRNWIHKLSSWQQPVTSNAGLTGLWVTASPIILNNVQRILIYGNIVDYSWASTQSGFAQNGYLATFSPKSFGNGTSGSGQPWVRVQDVTFADNVLRHGANGIEIVYQDPNDTQASALRLDIEENILYDVGSAWGAGTGLFVLLGQAQGPTIVNHNTILGGWQTGPELMNVQGRAPQFTFTNNILNDEGAGIKDAGQSNPAGTLSTDFPGIAFAGNIFAGQSAGNYGSFAQGNFFVPTMTAVGFTGDPTNGVSDYRVLGLSPSSSFAGHGADGTDPGASIAAVITADGNQ